MKKHSSDVWKLPSTEPLFPERLKMSIAGKKHGEHIEEMLEMFFEPVF